MSADPKLVLSFDESRVRELLSCALEGGIQYWGHVMGGSAPRDRETDELPVCWYPLGPGGAVWIRDHAGERDVTLTHELVWSAFEAFARKAPRQFANWWRGEADASTGDQFVQCALFGDVVYG